MATAAAAQDVLSAVAFLRVYCGEVEGKRGKGVYIRSHKSPLATFLPCFCFSLILWVLYLTFLPHFFDNICTIVNDIYCWHLNWMLSSKRPTLCVDEAKYIFLLLPSILPLSFLPLFSFSLLPLFLFPLAIQASTLSRWVIGIALQIRGSLDDKSTYVLTRDCFQEDLKVV